MVERASSRSAKYDQKLNTRFNIFDYLRTDEVGLSKLIADFLNPSAKHGQGSLFLEVFLNLLPIEGKLNDLSSAQVKVQTEYMIDSGRRIDIYVEINHPEQTLILAVENKPYAADSENQILDYLNFLDTKSAKFNLVYLTPDGKSPTDWALPNCERQAWRDQLVLMSYAKVEEFYELSEDLESEFPSEDEASFFQLCECSLADWFKRCKQRCEVDKLRWILYDAEKYCVKEFQGTNPSTNEEVLAVENFLLNNRHYIETAKKVHDSWRSVVGKIATQYFELLCKKIESRVSEELTIYDDLQFDPVFAFNGGYSYLSLYRRSWPTQEDSSLPAHGRCRIVLGHELKIRPDWWFIGVIAPYKSDELKERLNAEIPDCINTHPNWPLYKYFDSDYRDWESFLPKLINELENGNSEISDYYVACFLEFTHKALPIVDATLFEGD